jgi:uncharacterized protein YkwD
MNKVIKSLKHLFVPHEHNNYKPHILREASVIFISVLAIVLLSISAGTISYIKKNNLTATVLPAVILDLTNSARISNSQKVLTRNPTLDKVAKMKAEDMARLGYFAHNSPTGVTPWHWFDEAGYSFKYAGENLAINFTESADVENAWLASPTHKANILNSHFTEIGIATIDAVYQGIPTTFVVQSFGTPAMTPKKELSNKELAIATKPIKEVVSGEAPSNLKTETSSNVKGESVARLEDLETITETKSFVSVKNNSVETNADKALISQESKYSNWKERLIFLIPSYIDSIYHILILIVFTSLLIMSIVEIKIQHPKNIAYGILLIIIMTSFIYMNGSLFMGRLF